MGNRKPRVLIVAAIVMALSRTSAAAPEAHSGSQPSPSLERVLILKDGAIYRGEVIELVPHDYIILKLRSGAEKRFSWSSIERQSVPGAAATNPPAVKELTDGRSRQAALRASDPMAPSVLEIPATPSKQKSPYLEHATFPKPDPEKKAPSARRYTESEEEANREPTDENPPPRSNLSKLPRDLKPYKSDFVLLAMRSPKENLQLEYISDRFETGWQDGLGSPVSLESWKRACVYPCGEYVYRGATFRVTGPNMVDSPQFTLPKRGTAMELKVTPGSPAVRGAGIALDVLGSIAFVVGVALMVDTFIEKNSPDHRPLDDQYNWGLATTIVSGPVLGAGIALTRGGRTRIAVSRAPDLPPPPRPRSDEEPD